MTGVWRITRIEPSLSEQALIIFERWQNWSAFDRSVADGTMARVRPLSVLAHCPEEALLSVEGAGCFELQIIRVANGAGELARAHLVSGPIATYRASGASRLCLFDIIHGNDLPALALFCEWPNASVAVSTYLAAELMRGSADVASPILDTTRFLANRFSVLAN